MSHLATRSGLVRDLQNGVTDAHPLPSGRPPAVQEGFRRERSHDLVPHARRAAGAVIRRVLASAGLCVALALGATDAAKDARVADAAQKGDRAN